MSDDEKRLMTGLGLVVVVVLTMAVVFVSKKNENEAFKKRQRGPAATGRLSSIRKGMKNKARKSKSASKRAK